jgi:hypothetical protein
MGHRRNTWTYYNKEVESKQKTLFKSLQSKTGENISSQQPQSIFWPADLLPHVIPESRIITYGYDAKPMEIFKSVSQNSLYAISKELINDIQLARQREREV